LVLQRVKNFKKFNKSWKDPSVVKIAKRVDGKVTARYLLWKKTREKEH
jgi:hypothetical protein